MVLSRRGLLQLPAALLAGPSFRFGVVADIQYADKDPAGRRHYRDSLGKLEHCVAECNREDLAFAIQLGDLVDEGAANYGRILEVFNRIHAPRYHVRGNHDAGLSAARYYDFAVRGWRFLILDGMDVNATQPEGRAMLANLAGRPNAVDWNGAVGESQKRWLDTTLAAADIRHQRAIVFCHFPVLEGSATAPHLLWNAADVVAILERHPAMAAFINGHDHAGGYAERNGIHYLTLPGMVEAGACAVAGIYPDRIGIAGRLLPLPK